MAEGGNKRQLKTIRSAFLTAVVVLFLTTALFGFFLYGRIRAMTLRQIRGNALDVARIAASVVDPSSFVRIEPGGEEDAPYRVVLRALAIIRDNSDVEYLYTIRRQEDGTAVFVVDSDPVEPGKIGEPYSGSDAMWTALDGTASADDEPYRDRWGTHLSAYAPLLHDGETVGAAVVDLNYDWVQRELKRVSYLVAGLTAVYFAVGVLLLFLVTRLMEQNAIQLLEAKERAEESERAKDRFYANVSHEIRTPVNALLGMHEIILRKTRTGQADEATFRQIASHAETASAAGQQLRSMLDEILDFAKIDKVSGAEQPGADAAVPAGAQRFVAPDARVLAVDDIAINLSVLEGLLFETGVAIDRADSGDAALRLTKEQPYDLIFMDQRMPKMSGTQTLRAIRAQTEGKNRTTPVVCVTGDVLAGARETYLRDGFDDYLPKPLEPETLMDLMRRLLPKEKLRFLSPEEASVAGGGTGAAASSFAAAADNAPAGSAGSLRARYEESGILDYDAALKYLAKDALIEKTARQFYDDIERGIGEIERLVSAGDYENYKIKVHALKSSARMIGATALSAQAAELEALSRTVTDEGGA